MENERKYFININGNNIGPLKFDEITERLVNGLLNPDDYIFVAGNTNWSFIKDLEEFKEQVVSVKKPVSDKIWFVRKEKRNLGPLSTEDVTRMLASGVIDINDYAWKKGIPSWITLKESGEFTIRLNDIEEAQAAPVVEPKPKKDTSPSKVEQQVKPKVQTQDPDITPAPSSSTDNKSSLEMLKPPDSEEYVKPRKKRLLPELMLGLVLFAVGILELKTSELMGGLIAVSGIAVILIFLRINKR